MEMEVRELYERIKDYDPRNTLNVAFTELSIRVPDGKDNHPRDGLRGTIQLEIQFLERKDRKNIKTFQELYEKIPHRCEDALKKIYQATKQFGISV